MPNQSTPTQSYDFTHHISQHITAYLIQLITTHIVCPFTEKMPPWSDTLSAMAPVVEDLTRNIDIIRSEMKHAIDQCVDCWEMNSTSVFDQYAPRMEFVNSNGEVRLRKVDTTTYADIGKTTIEGFASMYYTMFTDVIRKCLESAKQNGLTESDLYPYDLSV